MKLNPGCKARCLWPSCQGVEYEDRVLWNLVFDEEQIAIGTEGPKHIMLPPPIKCDCEENSI